MKSPSRLLVLALFSALLGCGGGSSGVIENPSPTPPPVTITVKASPEAFVIPPSGLTSLLASVEGSSNQVVTWSSTAGQVTPEGMFTAPATKGPLTLLATSVANPASTVQVQVFVDEDGAASGQTNQAISASSSPSGIWPSSMTLPVGQTAMLLGYGGNPPDLRWALDEGTSAGTITSQGSLSGFAFARYQAPAAGGVFHASLTSVVDSTLHARAKIIVRGQGQVSVVVLPATASLLTNEGRNFTAQVTGTSNHTVNWSATSGSITSSGAYTAPSTPGTATLRATSVADPARFGEATVTTNSQPLPPSISSFTATTVIITSGQSSTLSWAVSGATSLSINNGVGTVTGTTRAVSPTATTTYTLTATNAVGSVTATATVTVNPAPQPPTISSFIATPSSLTVGQSSTLSWAVSGATSLSINNGVGTVTGTTRAVSPTATTTYTLTATNATGSVTATATVTVNPAPQSPTITSFTATPPTLTVGQSSTLSWTVLGATSLSIDSGVGTVTGTSTVVSPGATTTYTLTATNATGSVTATATVTVNPAPQPPTISSFIATPSTIIVGQSSTLSWAVSGATSLSIDNGVGDVTGTTSKIVSPTGTTTYTLTATNTAGSVTSTATVTVTPLSSTGCGSLDLGINSNLHGYRAFPDTSAWNQNISALPVDPNSTSIINFIGAGSGLKADFGSGLWQGSSIGIPYGVVGGTQAKVNINYQAYGNESDPGPMPIPSPPPIEGDDPLATTGDRHVLLLDRDNCILYELYGSQLQGNGSWNADSGSIWDLRTNTMRPYGWTSADAAGLPIFPGLARYDEVAAGAITHALRFTVPTSRRAYVSPASHWASSNTSTFAPPMGMRVRLKANVNISGYPPQSRVVLQALKTYGMILADNGSRWFMSGAPNAGWDNNDLQSLNGIKGSDLEVVQMGPIFTADPTGPAPAITLSASPATISAGQSSTLNWAVTDTSTVFITPNLGAPLGLVRGTSLVVTPGATTIYTLTATGPYGSTTQAVTVTVTVVPPPVISAFTAAPTAILPGQSSTLNWTVSGAASLTIAPIIGSVTGTSVVVSPTATMTYTLTAVNPAGTTTALATVTVNSGGFITPDNPGPADLQFAIHSGHNAHAISKWVYGFNGGDWSTMPNGTTLGRLGGNRWTAYNWETNASNAGSDWGPYSSDSYLSSSAIPGEAIRPSVANAQGANAAIIVTVPMQGWVAADEAGNVNVGNPVSTRFFPNLPKKPAALTTTPDTTDGKVYQDEFVHWLDSKFPTAKTDANRPVFYMLDNEPDLWNSTHLEIQRTALRYDQFLPLSIASAGAIKDQVSQALVFGPVSYGWNGFVNLQNAPDASAHGDFLDYYLSQMKTASQSQGRRLLDVLDLHWYSEAQGGGVRVVNQDNSAAVVAARVQAPRSLWDTTYTETSWITQWSTLGPIQLIPRMMMKISAQYPGTKLAFSEYNHGGEDHISGAIAEADCLGIFGRDNVFAANVWPLQSIETFLFGAFRIFRNYDGAGAAFGDTSMEALVSDVSKASVYSSLDAGHPNRVVTVLLNKDTVSHSAGLALTHTQAFTTAQVYQITASSPVQGNSVVPNHLSDIAITKVNAFTMMLPPYSITVVVWK